MKRVITATLALVILFSFFALSANADAKSILNNAKLTPLTTGYAPVDEAVSIIFKSIFTSKMTTYDKVRACDNWIIHNVEYEWGDVSSKSINSVMSASDMKYYSDARLTRLAEYLFDNHAGDCKHYAAALVIMLRAIGLDAYFMNGKNSKGTGHAFVNVIINGTYYVFDSQAEQNTVLKAEKNGNLKEYNYFRFCKTDSEIKNSSTPLTYNDRAGDISNFHNFAKNGNKLDFEAKTTTPDNTPSSSTAVTTVAKGFAVKFKTVSSGGGGSYAYDVRVAKGTSTSLDTYDNATQIADTSSFSYKFTKTGNYVIFTVVCDVKTEEVKFNTISIKVIDATINFSNLTISQASGAELGFTADITMTATGNDRKYTVTATHDDKQEVLLSSSTLNTVKWTPTEEGTYTIKATVKNDYYSVSKTVEFIVAEKQNKVELSGITVSENSYTTIGFTADISATAKGEGVTFTLTAECDGTITELLKNSTTCSCKWTPEKSGVYTLKVTAKNESNTETSSVVFVVSDGEGDVNGDGHLTLTDAMMIFRHVAKTDTLMESAISTADIDNSGSITLSDAMSVFRVIAKIDTVLK